MKTKYNLKHLLTASAILLSFFAFNSPIQASTTLNFSATATLALPSAQQVTITNQSPTGGQYMNWTSSTAYSSGSGWLTVTPSSNVNNSSPAAPDGPGALAPQASQQVSFQPNTTNLAAGTYVSTVTINGTNPDGSPSPGSPQTVTVNYTITSSCVVNVTSTYNGVAATLPPGSFSYTLSGPSTINGSGINSYNVPQNSNWTITYPVNGGSGSTLQSVTGAPSQTCTTGSVTFTFNFVDTPPCSGPGCPTVVAPAGTCETVVVSWPAGQNVFTYKIYRTTTTAVPAPNSFIASVSGSTLSWTDVNATANTTFYYWVAAENATTGIAPLGANARSNAIQTLACTVNLGTSDKVIVMVNGNTYAYTSSCIGNNGGTPMPSLKNGDRIRFSINVCNTGTKTVQTVELRDWPTNLTNLTAISGGSLTAQGDGSYIINVSGNIAQGQSKIVVIEATVTKPAGSTQTLDRFKNTVWVKYTTTGGGSTIYGCQGTAADYVTNPKCIIETPYYVFSNSRNASEKEINP